MIDPAPFDSLPSALRAPRRLPDRLGRARFNPTTGVLSLRHVLVGAMDGSGDPKTTALQLLEGQRPPDRRGRLTSIALAGDRLLLLEREARQGKVVETLMTAAGAVYYEASHVQALEGVSGVIVAPSLLRGTLVGTVAELQRLDRLLAAQAGQLDLATIPLVFLYLRPSPEAVRAAGDDACDPAELDPLLNPGGRPSFVAAPGDAALVAAAVDALTGLVFEDLRRVTASSQG